MGFPTKNDHFGSKITYMAKYMSPTADFPFQKMSGMMFLPQKSIIGTTHGNPQPSFLEVITHTYIGGFKPLYFMVLGSKAPWMLHTKSRFHRPTDLHRRPWAPHPPTSVVVPPPRRAAGLPWSPRSSRGAGPRRCYWAPFPPRRSHWCSVHSR